MCFACGSENSRGLGMSFRLEQGRAVAEFEAPRYLQGYPGHVHGGLVATMLDEAMGWAVHAQGIWAMTARLTTRFRRRVPPDQTLTVSGWVTRDRGRFLELCAEVRSPDGALLAQAEGIFARVAGRQAEELRELYEAAVSEPAAGRQTETMTSLQDGRP
jgi:acyl-coenzyme A thioesterase PaaI-like protein